MAARWKAGWMEAPANLTQSAARRPLARRRGVDFRLGRLRQEGRLRVARRRSSRRTDLTALSLVGGMAAGSLPVDPMGGQASDEADAGKMELPSCEIRRPPRPPSGRERGRRGEAALGEGDGQPTNLAAAINARRSAFSTLTWRFAPVLSRFAGEGIRDGLGVTK